MALPEEGAVGEGGVVHMQGIDDFLLCLKNTIAGDRLEGTVGGYLEFEDGLT